MDESTIYSTQRACAILLALAGMALQWAALHSITFLGTVFGTSSGGASESGAWIVNSAATFVAFLALFLLARRVASLGEIRWALPAMVACLAVGTLLFVAGEAFGLARPAIYAGNVIIAFGTTPLICMWGEVYRHLNPKGEQLLVTLGGIVLSVILYLVETCLPHAMAVAVFAAMQTGSVLCLWHARRLFEMQAHTWGARTRGPARRSPALLYVCIVVFSVPYNFLQAGDGMAGLLADAQAWAEVLSVTVVIMLAACLVECVAERRGVALMPLITLVLLGASMLVHLLEGMPPLLVPSLLYAGYYLFLAMVYLALGPIVATTDANPLRLFSGAMIANVAGLLVGSLLGGLLGSMGERAATMLVMGFAYGILFLGFALWRNRSYSIFRVNSYDEGHYSFEYLAPMPGGAAAPGEAQGEGAGPDARAGHGGPAGAGGGASASELMVEAISAQCRAVGREFDLSAREVQVLVELVRGRTIASIAEQLVVSENTAKAHTKAIYRKLGVHTREELAARVEAT